MSRTGLVCLCHYIAQLSPAASDCRFDPGTSSFEFGLLSGPRIQELNKNQIATTTRTHQDQDHRFDKGELVKLLFPRHLGTHVLLSSQLKVHPLTGKVNNTLASEHPGSQTLSGM
ncbi:hypothetical protein F4678DRAFT_444137, partial [Xylaria arbuscula]